MKTARSLIAVAVLCAGWAVFAQAPPTKQVPTPKATAPSPKTEKPADVPAKATNGKTSDTKAADSKSARSDDAESADELAIRESAEVFAKAYNAHDAKAVSLLYALKAEMTDEDGNLLKGRDAIEQDFDQTFKEFPECKIQIEIESIRILTPNIAVEEGIVRGQPIPDQGENVSSYVAVHVKVDGKWSIASVSDFEAPAELSPRDHLQELSWMVGDWIEESPDSHVKSSCRWDDSGNYLLHDFVLHIPGGVVASGSIRIAWDQMTGQFKSWAFDADGGYSEGLWTQDGNEWIVKARGANPRGEAMSSTNVYRYVDQDTMTWRSYDRVVGGKRQPSVPETFVKRQSPPPKN